MSHHIINVLERRGFPKNVCFCDDSGGYSSVQWNIEPHRTALYGCVRANAARIIFSMEKSDNPQFKSVMVGCRRRFLIVAAVGICDVIAGRDA